MGYGAIDYNEKIYGIYKMEPGLVNSHQHYTSVNGKYAITYCDDDGKKQWVIQTVKNRGRCTGSAYTNVRSSENCAHDALYTWRYYKSSTKEWLNAEKSLSIWCKSDFN